MPRDRLTRRGFVGLAGTVIGLGSAVETGGADPGDAAWPATGRNWRNTGFTGTSTVPESPVIAWQRSLSGQTETSPVVAYGLVVVPSDGTLHALDARTGDVVWTSDATDYADRAAAFADGNVVAGGDALLALDRTSGEPDWRVDLDAPLSGPVVPVYQLLYVPTADGRVLGVDPQSGDQQWAVSTGSDGVRIPVEDGEGTAFLAAGDTLRAHNRASGERQWETKVTGTVVGSPVLTSSAVVVATGESRIAAVDFEGEPSWERTLDVQPVTTPALLAGNYPLFFSESRLQAYVPQDDRFAIDVALGATPVTAPAVSEGVVYGTEDGALVTRDGPEVRWRMPIGRTVTGRPTLAYDAVFFSDDAGTVTAVAGDEGIASASEQVTATDRPTTAAETPTQANRFFGDEERQVTLPVETLVGGGGLLAGAGLLALLWRRGRGSGTDRDSRATPGESGPDTSTGDGASRRQTTGSDGSANGSVSARTATSNAEPSVSDDSWGGSGDSGSPLDTSNGGQRPDEIPEANDAALTYDDLGKQEHLGSGGNAQVYLATATVDGERRRVAVKEPHVQGTLHTETAERLMREAETWSDLDDHDHVVGVVDWGSEPLPWIAMEYMDGGHLGTRIQGPSYFERLWIAYGIVSAVREAHRAGVAHLDLKPANVLFRETPEGTWDVPKVADWGLSKRLLDHSTSVEGLSPAYAAPEQFDDSYGSTDEVTDVYQTGTVLYELFTGRPPFEGGSAQVMQKVLEEPPPKPSSVNPELPPAVEEMTLSALRKDKTDRYDSMVYLRDDLRDIVRGIDG